MSKEEMGSVPQRISLAGDSSILWDICRDLVHETPVQIESTLLNGHQRSAGSGWEAVVISISSAGGIAALARVIVEVLRSRRTTLDIRIGDEQLHFEGAHVNLENVLSEFRAIQDRQSQSIDRKDNRSTCHKDADA